MAKVGAQRAAELTGKSKSTIQRSMNNGKLSFELDANNRRIIDVSELDRVFGLNNSMTTESSTSSAEVEIQKASDMIEMERMKMRIKMLEEKLYSTEVQLEDLKDQRNQWQKQAQQILITSQYSQKQAEELQSELKSREAKEEERKQKVMEMRMKKLKGQNQNSVSNSNTSQTQAEQKSSTPKFTDIWKRIKNKVNTDKAA